MTARPVTSMSCSQVARQLEMYRGDSHLSLLHSSRTGPATLDRCSPRRYNQPDDPRQPLYRNRKTGLGFQVRRLSALSAVCSIPFFCWWHATIKSCQGRDVSIVYARLVSPFEAGRGFAQIVLDGRQERGWPGGGKAVHVKMAILCICEKPQGVMGRPANHILDHPSARTSHRLGNLEELRVRGFIRSE